AVRAQQCESGFEFLWLRPPSCPYGLPLYLLKEGDCRTLAASVSCGQDIAGDGAFSLAMLADYMDSLVSYGASFCQRRLNIPQFPPVENSPLSPVEISPGAER
ncbi:MAG: hypothetical protein AAB654_12355, partial [Acidobacteriota bacterium]